MERAGAGQGGRGQGAGGRGQGAGGRGQGAEARGMGQGAGGRGQGVGGRGQGAGAGGRDIFAIFLQYFCKGFEEFANFAKSTPGPNIAKILQKYCKNIAKILQRNGPSLGGCKNIAKLLQSAERRHPAVGPPVTLIALVSVDFKGWGQLAANSCKQWTAWSSRGQMSDSHALRPLSPVTLEP